jgi:hypothetical protein
MQCSSRIAISLPSIYDFYERFAELYHHLHEHRAPKLGCAWPSLKTTKSCLFWYTFFATHYEDF